MPACKAGQFDSVKSGCKLSLCGPVKCKWCGCKPSLCRHVKLLLFYSGVNNVVANHHGPDKERFTVCQQCGVNGVVVNHNCAYL